MEQPYLGSYRIMGTLGQGAFGVVYRAYQPFLDRQVAIKTLQAARTTNPMDEQDFMREARTIARLRHHNIVSVYEFATTPHKGQPLTYMVMEYLPGETLEQRLARGRLPVETAINILERLAVALDYAHARSVIHRDLKPSNIIFNELDEPVIVDFGLAKLVEMTELSDADSPQASHARGTPAYMSPEQITGVNIGAASDQYTLGLIAFQMLTGEHAFNIKQTISQILMERLQSQARRLTDVAPEYPEAAAVIFDRVFSENPALRYPTVTAFIEDLAEVLLPDRAAPHVITVADPVQAALLRATRQTLAGTMWGVLGMLGGLIIFCIAMVSNGYISGSPFIFVWDGVYTETTTAGGWRTVTGTLPGSVAERAGFLPGDRVKGDLLRDSRQTDTDYTINGIPRSALSISWQPGPGDVIERLIERNGQSLPVKYRLEVSGYMLLLLALSLPPALVSMSCAAWLLRRWGAEPGLQAFFLVLVSLSSYQLSALLSQALPVLQGVVGFLVLSTILHFMLIFPRRLALLERRPRLVWAIYAPALLPLLLFMTGALYFTGWLTVTLLVLLVLVLLLIYLFIFKWLRQDYRHYPGMGLFLIGFSLVVFNALMSVLNRSMNFQTMTLLGITGFGHDMLFQGVRFVSACINPIIQAAGYHRIQTAIGSSLPPEDGQPVSSGSSSDTRKLIPAGSLKSTESHVS